MGRTARVNVRGNLARAGEKETKTRRARKNETQRCRSNKVKGCWGFCVAALNDLRERAKKGFESRCRRLLRQRV